MLHTTTESALLKNTALEVKIGQMLMVGFRGLAIDADHPITQDILHRHVGGVIFFDYDLAHKKAERNIQSPQQVKELVAALQGFSKIPLFIAIDYEGGTVNRLEKKYGFPSTVSPHYLGSTNDLAITHHYALTMAQTLAELGINLNIAPVVDLDVNVNNPIIAKRKRSFSADPQVVAAHALEFIRAHHEYGVLCTLKHFPGHGSSMGDSHHGLVDVTNTWSSIELQPFARIIEAGEADAIMTAHVFNANLDAEYPATLSHAIITGILRKELRYQGVIVSDDMQMKAITDYYGLETALHKTIEAGIDMIVMGNNTGVFEEDIAIRAVAIIKRLVEHGIISRQRIDESYQRILRLKSRLMSVG